MKNIQVMLYLCPLEVRLSPLHLLTFKKIKRKLCIAYFYTGFVILLVINNISFRENLIWILMY